jgi:putative membrane protein
MRKLATGATAALLTVSACGAAAGAAAAQPMKPSKQDSAWMKSNAQTDLAEISAGKLVQSKSSNPDTLKLAKVTESQHTMVLTKLRGIARDLHVTLPTSPSQTQLRQASQLKSLKGLTFDRKYDALQIAGHKLSISQTKTEIAKGSSSTVTGFAQRYLPVAEMHLKMAEQLKGDLRNP